MSTLQKRPMELVKGDVITLTAPVNAFRAPHHLGEWTVSAPPVQCDDVAEVEVIDDRGDTAHLALSVHGPLAVNRTPRQELIAGLRAMADWLEATPGVPVDEFEGAYLQHCVDLTDATDRRAYVDAAAAEMGVKAIKTGGHRGHYAAIKRFGPVEYRAVSCKPDDLPMSAAKPAFEES